MKKTPQSRTVRRSVALPRRLVDEATALASPDQKQNFNSLVRFALQEFAARRKASAFEEAMARMARDPAIRRESSGIDRHFAGADADGLGDDQPRRHLLR